MTFPYLLCAGAVAAAALAALAGYLLNPVRRRRLVAIQAHRGRIRVQLARDPASWQRWWDERLAAGLDDEADMLRGGA